MSALRSAGERMGRYALAKRQAVVQEDFIAAKLRKEQIEMYKNAVFAHLRVEALMERDKVKLSTCPASDRENYEIVQLSDKSRKRLVLRNLRSEAHSSNTTKFAGCCSNVSRFVQYDEPETWTSRYWVNRRIIDI